jgi:hypothetical protein
MAWATFNGNELDAITKIEDGVSETLNREPSARVRLAGINDYDVLDADMDIVPSTVEEKCAFIAEKLGVDYKIDGDCVVFLRKRLTR